MKLQDIVLKIKVNKTLEDLLGNLIKRTKFTYQPNTVREETKWKTPWHYGFYGNNYSLLISAIRNCDILHI